MASDVLTTTAPDVSEAEAEAIAARHFGLTAKARVLSSERDRNFHLTAPDGRAYVLKLANPAEPAMVTNFQTEVLLHLERVDPGLPVPRMVRSLSGGPELTLDFGGVPMVVRLLTYLDGLPIVHAGATPAQMRNLGTVLARLDKALAGFEHVGARRELLWDAGHPGQVRGLLQHIPDAAGRDLVGALHDRFETVVAPRLDRLRAQVIHNDLNPHNAVVDHRDHDVIAGIIDFGDAIHAPMIVDLGTALAYQLTDSAHPLERIVDFVAAYHTVMPLLPEEIDLLPDLIVARMVLTVSITHWRAALAPENRDYILRNNPRAWTGLRRLAALPRADILAQLRQAAA